MTIDLNRLKTMKKEELIKLAKETNTPYHHANKESTLIENIINHTMKVSMPTQTTEKTKEIKETVFLTEAELEEAFAPIKEKYPAFSTIYNTAEGWMSLRYNDGRYRHEETLNLSNTLAKFKRKALEIAKGPLVLRAHSERDFERITVTSKNAYTAAVLG